MNDQLKVTVVSFGAMIDQAAAENPPVSLPRRQAMIDQATADNPPVSRPRLPASILGAHAAGVSKHQEGDGNAQGAILRIRFQA